jgi:hypothetical protein
MAEKMLAALPDIRTTEDMIVAFPTELADVSHETSFVQGRKLGRQRRACGRRRLGSRAQYGVQVRHGTHLKSE